FFQAEDGIRDFHVTGVQTCALPISPVRNQKHFTERRRELSINTVNTPVVAVYPNGEKISPKGAAPSRTASCPSIATGVFLMVLRSEERRVGKVGRCTRPLAY